MQYLYLIECQHLYKVGIAIDVESRMAQLSTGNPFPLNVLAVYAFSNAEPIEKAIHRRFANTRVRGEWFKLSASDIEQIKGVCVGNGGTPYIAPPKVRKTGYRITKHRERIYADEGIYFDENGIPHGPTIDR